MGKLVLALVVIVVGAIGGLLVWNHIQGRRPQPGTLLDEARLAGRDAASLPGADEDYYHDMDYGITKNPGALRAALDPYVPGITPDVAVKAAVRGRNNWIVWTAGNDRLWDVLSRSSAGNLDLLKTLSNHPSLKANRDNRWKELGLVNEPCFRKATGPREDRWGLWLDERVEGPGCPPDPFENEQKYPGVKIGARGTGKLAVGSYYGYATGIVGLRLFPNPDFDEKAQKAWDTARNGTETATTRTRAYYNRADLVRPFRVGMSCGFCHVGPNPTNPPADPEKPEWANLNRNPARNTSGSIASSSIDKNAARRTSLPALPHVPPGHARHVARLERQHQQPAHHERDLLARRAARSSQAVRQGNAGRRLVEQQAVQRLPGNRRARGSTAARHGAVAARAQGRRRLGGSARRAEPRLPQHRHGERRVDAPFHAAHRPDAEARSGDAGPDRGRREESRSGRRTRRRRPPWPRSFWPARRPDYLKDAPGGVASLTASAQMRTVAKTCSRSAAPGAIQQDPEHARIGVGGNCRRRQRAAVSRLLERVLGAHQDHGIQGGHEADRQGPDFLKDNFLSSERRVPVTLLQTNACSPLATNALQDNIWDNFSSRTYKDLP